MKSILYLSIPLLFLALIRCGVGPLSGTTSSENGKVVGAIVTDAGFPAPNTIVKLIFHDYNPALDGPPAGSSIDTTGPDGAFHFSIPRSGIYNIEAVHATQRTRLLIRGIAIRVDTVHVPTDTLKPPGTIRLFVPDSLGTKGAYAVIKGTTICTGFSKPVSDGGSSIAIDSVPEATIPAIHYQSATESRILSDTITVTANDTAEIEAFLFWTHYTASNSGLKDNRIEKVHFTKNGDMWVAPFFSGLARLNGTTWTQYDKTTSIVPDVITDIAQDRRGTLLAGTDKGLLTFNGTQWKLLDSNDMGLPSHHVTCIVADAKDNLWFGLDGGIAFFNNYQMTFTFYDSAAFRLETNWIRDVAIDSGRIVWFATEKGVARYDFDSWIPYTKTTSGIPDEATWCVAVDTNDYKWFGHSRGVSRTDGKQWTLYDANDSPLLGAAALDIFVDGANGIWVGTEYGLTMFDGKQWHDYNDKQYRLLAKKRIKSIAKDMKGNVWVGTYDSGVIGFGPTAN